MQIGELHDPNRRPQAGKTDFMACQREMVCLFAALHERRGAEQAAVAEQELPTGESLDGIRRGQLGVARLFGCRQ